MATITISVKFTEVRGIDKPKAAVYLDANQDKKLNDAKRILSFEGESGKTKDRIDDDKVQGMQFVLVYLAGPGSRFDVELKSDGKLGYLAKGIEVDKDRDLCFLIGNIDLNAKWE